MAVRTSGITIEDCDLDVLSFTPEIDSDEGERILVRDNGGNALLAITPDDARAPVDFLGNWLKSVGE